MRKLQGSMTVEAVFVMGLILLVMLWMMKAAIGLYLQTAELAQESQPLWEDTAGIFRRLFFIGKGLP